jgi:hypothetical protein
MEECPICYEDMPAPARLKCGHTFHKHCIDKWAEDHCTCPYCRYVFRVKLPPPNLDMSLAMLRIVTYTLLFLFLLLFAKD